MNRTRSVVVSNKRFQIIKLSEIVYIHKNKNYEEYNFFLIKVPFFNFFNVIKYWDYVKIGGHRPKEFVIFSTMEEALEFIDKCESVYNKIPKTIIEY